MDLRRVRLWLRSLLRPNPVEKDLEDEVRLHVEMETEKNIKAGMEPAEARRKAMIDFGGVERYKEQTREARSTRPFENLWGAFDLALCLDVGEHIPESRVGVFLDNITQFADTLLLACASPGQGGHHHVNEQRALDPVALATGVAIVHG